jgi:hypothetical protein
LRRGLLAITICLSTALYAATGTLQSLRLELRARSTVLAGVTVPSNSTAAWRRVESLAQLTQAQIDDLHLSVSLSGTRNSTPARVYAA